MIQNKKNIKKAAHMKCVCVPDESIIGNTILSKADLVLPSLKDFNEEIWNRLNI